MLKSGIPAFRLDVPADLDHVAEIRMGTFHWLDQHYQGVRSFDTGTVLGIIGERKRRWLIKRLRDKGIGNQEEFDLPSAVDALAVLYLRSNGVKFGEAVRAVMENAPRSSPEQSYGGLWNRLIAISLERVSRRVPPRLLGSAISALLNDPNDQPNCLVIVKRVDNRRKRSGPNSTISLDHEYVYGSVLERPAPSCFVLSPSREVLTLTGDQLPIMSEVTTRHFVGVEIETPNGIYEVMLGTIRHPTVTLEPATEKFVGRVLDIMLVHFEKFVEASSVVRLELPTEPEPSSTDDIQLWLITQLLNTIYPGSFCEITEASESPLLPRVLASSAAKPWEASLWEPAKGLEMLSGYASQIAVPLVVEKVEHPWTLVIESVESEMRFLNTGREGGKPATDFSAMALPVFSSLGVSMGSLYLLTPHDREKDLDIEVRILSVFSQIVGETIERQRAVQHSSTMSSEIANMRFLEQEQFKGALLNLLRQMASEIRSDEFFQGDVRLPFLILSAHELDDDAGDTSASMRLKNWLVRTLHHLEWHSFVRSHWPHRTDAIGPRSFIGELPGTGVVIVLDALVSKDELDRIRNAFSGTINRISPTNAPVKLLTWVLDISADRIVEAASKGELGSLAEEVERWAFDVVSVVDDVAQSDILARDQGDWDSALRRIRRALKKDGARDNSYLRRIAADCSFSLGDWPVALKYAQEASEIDRKNPVGGLARSLCQEADARLCLGDPIGAWDLYTEAAARVPTHPLPKYYRGQALLLIARLLHAFQDENLRSENVSRTEAELLDAIIDTLATRALDDLTSAADLLERWGLIPESRLYRNFHQVPTLMGQGLSYLIGRSPGPAASRLQSARRSFPRDDLFFREFIFAKCWEQGLHQRFGRLVLSDEWEPLRERINGEP
jgi:tetratricopeptide (TPR) repeat protein